MYRCDERDFNVCRFDGPVAKYPFSDHNAPQFEQIIALCEDVNEFLSQDPKNVVAINCKAGKVNHLGLFIYLVCIKFCLNCDIIKQIHHIFYSYQFWEVFIKMLFSRGYKFKLTLLCRKWEV